MATMYAITWFYHWTVTGQHTVRTDEFHLGAEVAWGLNVKARHLASVLLALDESDDILASGNAGIGIFEGVAYASAIDGEATVSVFASDKGAR